MEHRSTLYVEAISFAEVVCASAPLLDVRAPVEFHRAHLPEAINLPLLFDDERAEVGIRYKQGGAAEATALGHRLVSGTRKLQRVERWLRFLQRANNPMLYCARGGLRSRIAQEWIREQGVPVRRIRGGYKALRRYLLQQLPSLTDNVPLLVVAGHTGSGKTMLLRRLAACGVAVLDLERLANHRGSAFGNLGVQPGQATFENHIAVELLRTRHRDPPFIVVESESRTIGRCLLPAPLHLQMLRSPVAVLQRPFEERAGRIAREYVLEFERSLLSASEGNKARALEQHFLSSLTCLRKRLGDALFRDLAVRLAESMQLYKSGGPLAVHRAWIEPLLRNYYDVCYDSHLQKQLPRIVCAANEEQMFELILKAWQSGGLRDGFRRRSVSP